MVASGLKKSSRDEEDANEGNETNGENLVFGGKFHRRGGQNTIVLETSKSPWAFQGSNKGNQRHLASLKQHLSTANSDDGEEDHLVNPEMDEEDEARLNLALYRGSPKFPLPHNCAQYPVYDGYPQEILDIQIRERNKVLLLSKEVTRRESTLKLLEKKIEDIEKDHETWMVTHENATRTEFQHHRSMMEQEKQYYRELQRIEEEISGQRIRALDSLEMAAKQELQVMDIAMQEAQLLLQEKEQHLAETMASNIMLQKHREMSEKTEHTTMEKMRQLRLRRTREDVRIMCIMIVVFF